MTVPPDKQAVHRILEMQGAGLLSCKHLQPWACALIDSLDRPPAWLCELACLTYSGDIDRCLREFVFSAPFEDFDQDALADYAVACLVRMCERRELSWATCLRRAGELSDSRQQGREPCEFYYSLLNELEDREFDSDVESRQMAEVKALLASACATVVADFEPFAAAFRQRLTEGRTTHES